MAAWESLNPIGLGKRPNLGRTQRWQEPLGCWTPPTTQAQSQPVVRARFFPMFPGMAGLSPTSSNAGETTSPQASAASPSPSVQRRPLGQQWLNTPQAIASSTNNAATPINDSPSIQREVGESVEASTPEVQAQNQSESLSLPAAPLAAIHRRPLGPQWLGQVTPGRSPTAPPQGNVASPVNSPANIQQKTATTSKPQVQRQTESTVNNSEAGLSRNTIDSTRSLKPSLTSIHRRPLGQQWVDNANNFSPAKAPTSTPATVESTSDVSAVQRQTAASFTDNIQRKTESAIDSSSGTPGIGGESEPTRSSLPEQPLASIHRRPLGQHWAKLTHGLAPTETSIPVASESTSDVAAVQRQTEAFPAANVQRQPESAANATNRTQDVGENAESTRPALPKQPLAPIHRRPLGQQWLGKINKNLSSEGQDSTVIDDSATLQARPEASIPAIQRQGPTTQSAATDSSVDAEISPQKPLPEQPLASIHRRPLGQQWVNHANNFAPTESPTSTPSASEVTGDVSGVQRQIDLSSVGDIQRQTEPAFKTSNATPELGGQTKSISPSLPEQPLASLHRRPLGPQWANNTNDAVSRKGMGDTETAEPSTLPAIPAPTVQRQTQAGQTPVAESPPEPEVSSSVSLSKQPLASIHRRPLGQQWLNKVTPTAPTEASSTEFATTESSNAPSTLQRQTERTVKPAIQKQSDADISNRTGETIGANKDLPEKPLASIHRRPLGPQWVNQGDNLGRRSPIDDATQSEISGEAPTLQPAMDEQAQPSVQRRNNLDVQTKNEASDVMSPVTPRTAEFEPPTVARRPASPSQNEPLRRSPTTQPLVQPSAESTEEQPTVQAKPTLPQAPQTQPENIENAPIRRSPTPTSPPQRPLETSSPEPTSEQTAESQAPTPDTIQAKAEAPSSEPWRSQFNLGTETNMAPTPESWQQQFDFGDIADVQASPEPTMDIPQVQRSEAPSAPAMPAAPEPVVDETMPSGTDNPPQSQQGEMQEQDLELLIPVLYSLLRSRLELEQEGIHGYVAHPPPWIQCAPNLALEPSALKSPGQTLQEISSNTFVLNKQIQELFREIYPMVQQRMERVRAL